MQLHPIPVLEQRALDGEQRAIALFAPIRHLEIEAAMIAYLDAKWRLLAVRTTPSQRCDMVGVPIRLIVLDALAVDAAGVVMAHNHPSGDPTPSSEDRTFTRRLARALDAVGIRLIDHLVLAGSETDSFRRIGLL